MTDPFWKNKSLDKMTANEWESLCDGCGRCCLVKLQDDETEEVYLTNIACQLLDIENCRCSDYEKRFKKVPICMDLRKDLADMVNYLPESCAYRLLYNGQPLANWHPLLSLNTEPARRDMGFITGTTITCGVEMRG